MDDQNNPQADARVSFGPLPNQTVPVEWASVMLQQLRIRNPKLLGVLLVHAAGLDEKPKP